MRALSLLHEPDAQPAQSRHLLRLCLCMLALLSCGPALHAMEAKEVFARTSPSAVVVQSVDSLATGIVLNEGGLILTSHQTVVCGVGVKLKVAVKSGGKVALQEITDVTLLKVHPLYDLALVQAKVPGNGTLVPATFRPRETAVESGDKCYIVGSSAGPDGKTHSWSITEGLVSAPSRKLEGGDYIQVSAAMNPANSGAPLCDDAGKVAGIVAWRMDNAERIGFAIPWAKVKLEDFVPVTEKAGDPALAKVIDNLGVRFNFLANSSDGDAREAFLRQAITCYRLAMAAEPKNPLYYRKAGYAYVKIQQWELAAPYFEAALRVDPKDPGSLRLLGEYHAFHGGGGTTPATELWLRILGSPTEPYSTSLGAAHLAGVMMEQKKPEAAAYLLRWALTATDKATLPYDAREKLDRLKEGLKPLLPNDEYLKLKPGGAPFDLATFTTLRDGGVVMKPAPLPERAPAAPTAPEAIAPLPAESMKQLISQAGLKHGAVVAPLAAGGSIIQLPFSPVTLTLCDAGWRMVFASPTERKTGIFNLSSLKVDGVITHEEAGALSATGGNLLAIYLPTSRKLELYDLATLQKQATLPLDTKGQVIFIAMGLHNPGRLVALTSTGGEQVSPAIVTLPGGAISLPEPQVAASIYWRRGVTNGDFHGAMDDSGLHCAVSAWAVGNNPAGVFTVQSGGGLDFTETPADSQRKSGPVGLSSDGRLVIGNEAVFATTRLQNRIAPSPKGNVPAGGFAPISGFDGFIGRIYESKSEVVRDGYEIYNADGGGIVHYIPIPPEVLGDRRAPSSETRVVSMVASAPADRLVQSLVDKGSQRPGPSLYVAPLGLREALAGSGVARVGQPFERKLPLPAGSSVVLEHGPPGLRLDAASLTLRWDVPASQPQGRSVRAILLLQKPDGTQEYVIERIPVL